MTVRLYRSTDVGAPVLTGQTGSLVALLDACLVNGYGALAAAGWTKAYSTVNKAAYRQNAAGANNAANPMYLYIDDTGPGAASSREARATGFETMTAIAPTGTGQFPTAAQSSVPTGACVIRKSNTADATARAWTLIANGQSLYLFTESGDCTAPFATLTFFFGDIKSYKAGDLYAVMIMGRMVENISGQANQTFYDPMQALGGNGNYTLNSKMWGHFMARSWTALGGSIQVSKLSDMNRVTGMAMSGTWSADNVFSHGNNGANITMGRINGTAQLATPNGPDGGIWLAPVYVHHNWSFRGYMPGLWCPLHDRPFQHNDTMTIASGPLTGKSLLAQIFPAWIGNNTNENGQCCVEYSDTWS